MGLQGINPDAVRQYVSPRDPAYPEWRRGSTDGATVFSLRVLSARHVAEVLDSTQETVSRADGTRGIRIDMNRRNVKLVETAVVGWSNLLDARGNQIAFELEHDGLTGPRMSRRSLDALAPWLVRELAAEILKDNTFSESDLKNSDAS
jgi:hypothetical protein